MAREYLPVSRLARDLMQEADDLLHIPLSKIMLEGPEEVLRQTEYTQPAIFLHSIIALDTHDDPLNYPHRRGRRRDTRSENTLRSIMGLH